MLLAALRIDEFVIVNVTTVGISLGLLRRPAIHDDVRQVKEFSVRSVG
jgi:hypothetical protein